MSFSASYIWSRGVRLYGVRDLNVNPAANPITYTVLNPAGAISGTYTTNTFRSRPDSRYRRVAQIDNPGLSYYNGLALQFNKRFAKGLQLRRLTPGRTRSISTRAPATTTSSSEPRPPCTITWISPAEKGSAANDVRTVRVSAPCGRLRSPLAPVPSRATSSTTGS
jgi:hypothetical protein